MVEMAKKTIGKGIKHPKEPNRSKTDFVSLASHQLRAPLTGIMWTAELFSENEKLSKNGRRYLQDIIRSATRLNTLIKLLLNVSRIDTKRIAIKPEPLNLVDFMKGLLNNIKKLSEEKKLAPVFVKYPRELTATTDKSALDCILRTIIKNAVEYTHKGGKVEINLENKGNSAFFTVRDTGIGIPKAEQARIFERFFRASNAFAINKDGNGLGLYVASEAAKLLGGKIWFRSEEGKGSVFHIKIPLVTKALAGEKGFAPM